MRTLPRRLTGVDSETPKFGSCAAALLGALATALHCRIINVSAVARIDPDVFQGLAFRADVVVLLGYVGKLRGAIEISRPIGVLFHPDVRSDAAFIEPLQKLTVAVSVVCCQCLRQVAVTFAIAFDHSTRCCA